MSNVGDMPCRDWEDIWAMCHPDDLSPAQWMKRQRHIASCPACASVLSEYQEMDECIRRALIPSRPLELPADFAFNQRSSSQRQENRGKEGRQAASPLPRPTPSLVSTPIRNKDSRSLSYTVSLEARCMSQYMEVLPEQLVGAEVLVEVHLGVLLFSLFESVSVEDVSLHFFPAPPRGRQFCSIQMQANCQTSGETQPQYVLTAMELTVEETIRSILQELFGVVNVDAVNIRCFAQEQDGKENSSSKSA